MPNIINIQNFISPKAYLFRHILSIQKILLDLMFTRAEALRPCSGLKQSAALQLFKKNTFDIVFARFLLQYLAKPQHAVSEMIRVCRPGGRILLQDLDGQLVWHYPEETEIMRKTDVVLSYLKEKTAPDIFSAHNLHVSTALKQSLQRCPSLVSLFSFSKESTYSSKS